MYFWIKRIFWILFSIFEIYLFENDFSLATIEIQGNVTKICDYTFCICKSLQPPFIIEKIEIFEQHSFSSCFLSSFNIPDSVNKIGVHLNIVKNCCQLFYLLIWPLLMNIALNTALNWRPLKYLIMWRLFANMLFIFVSFLKTTFFLKK